MAVYIQKTTDSDLTPTWPNTSSFDKEMSVGTGTDTGVTVSLTSNETQSSGFISPVGVPNSDAWDSGGTQTVELEMDTGNHQITARCRIVRLNSTGTILQSGSFTGLQALSSSVSFSPVAPTWTGGQEACDNRMAIEFEWNENQGMANSVTVGLGTTANEVTTDIAENTAGCITRRLFSIRMD